MRNRPTTNRKLWVVPHIQVQNANITTSPLVYGFPSMTAFTGLMDALTRDLARSDVHLDDVGVIVHSFESNTNNSRVKRFYPAKHPGTATGENSPIIEEGKGHFEISLVFNVRTNEELNEEDDAQWSSRLMELLRPRRIAGGTIVDIQRGHVVYLSDAQGADDNVADTQFQKLMYSLMPGYALVQRHDQMDSENPLDRVLEVCRLRSECVTDEDGVVSWHVVPRSGWLVPIAAGYRALGPVQAIAGTRDSTTPARFVECIYSIGQWISTHRLLHPHTFWWYNAVEKNDWYLCKNDFI